MQKFVFQGETVHIFAGAALGGRAWVVVVLAALLNVTQDVEQGADEDGR
jgi:Na+-transporting NADH:ubiquinone oxidoreductase subunit NqrB